MSCSPCTDNDPNGVASCDKGQCGIACDAGYRLCGTACTACPSASGVESFSCDAAQKCGVAECKVGYYRCGDVCCAYATEAVFTGSAGNPSMALDASGKLHVAFVKGSSGLMYAVRTGPQAWSVQPVGSASGAGSIAVDASGTPTIVYRASYSIRAATLNGATWTDEAVYQSSRGYGPEVSSQSVVIDSAGAPHVLSSQTAYVDSRTGYRTDFSHHWKDSGAWKMRSVTSGARSSGATLAIGAGGQLVGTWINWTPGMLTVATFSGTSWQLASVSQATCCDTPFVSMTRSSAFIPFKYSSGVFDYVERQSATSGSQVRLGGPPMERVGNLRQGTDGTLRVLWFGTVNSKKVLHLTRLGSPPKVHALAIDAEGGFVLDSTNVAHVVYATSAGLTYVSP
jgi:hypothetical protein